MFNTDKKVIALVFTAILAALVVVLQLVGGIPVGPFSITLTLFPIVVGAVVLGPVPGLALGVIFGIIVSILSLTGKDPGGFMVFQANPVLGWVMCVLKGALAGLMPALACKLFTRFKKHSLSITYTITGVFIFGAAFAVSKQLRGVNVWLQLLIMVLAALAAGGLLFGMSKLLTNENAAYYNAAVLAPIFNTGTFVVLMLLWFKDVLSAWSGGSNILLYSLTGLVGINFLIEFFVVIILTP
ncbi:MAG: ECF transporter S component, partial [Clostridia bacterium]|nr:ECF transporter S component [Clostridia bacterium]